MIAADSSLRVAQNLGSRTFLCTRAKKDSIAALSPHAPTRPIEPLRAVGFQRGTERARGELRASIRWRTTPRGKPCFLIASSRTSTARVISSANSSHTQRSCAVQVFHRTWYSFPSPIQCSVISITHTIRTISMEAALEQVIMNRNTCFRPAACAWQ